MIITLAPGPTPPSTRGVVYLPFVATPPPDPVAEFGRLLTTEFDCPALASAQLERHAESLGLTLATLRMIRPVVAE